MLTDADPRPNDALLSGFIDVFGTKTNPVTGAKALDAVHVSLWGGTQYIAQVLFQGLSPLTSDRFGIKINLYLLTGGMLVVRRSARDHYWGNCFT